MAQEHDNGLLNLGAGTQAGDISMGTVAGGDVEHHTEHHITVNHYGAPMEALVVHLVETFAREAQRQRLRERMDEIEREAQRRQVGQRLARIEFLAVALLLVALVLCGLALYLLTRQPAALSSLVSAGALAVWRLIFHYAYAFQTWPER